MADVEGGGLSLQVFGATGIRDISVNGSATAFGLNLSPQPQVADLEPDASGIVAVSEAILVEVQRDALDTGQWSVELFVRYPHTDKVEVVYDGVAFTAGFAATSTLTITGATLSFNVLPTGGWPNSPTLDYRAILLP